MDESHLPIYNGPVDRIRNGFEPLDTGFSTHPVKELLINERLLESTQKIDKVRRQYGVHMAMRLASENMMSEHVNRLPGLSSSKVMADTFSGRENRIDFEDYLGDPNYNPNVIKTSVHSFMEKKLQIL